MTGNYILRTPSAAAVPVIVHVPHAATAIPAQERAGILLDDAALERELVRLTDWHVDRLFNWTSSLGATMYVNAYSRLLIDPERFPEDDRESMAQVGQGAVYTRTTDGRPDICIGTDSAHTPPGLADAMEAVFADRALLPC